VSSSCIVAHSRSNARATPGDNNRPQIFVVSARGDHRKRRGAQASDSAGESLAGRDVDAVLHGRRQHWWDLRLRHEGNLSSRRVAPAGIDQHDTRRFALVLTREQPHEDPAVGVTHEHMRGATASRSSRRLSLLMTRDSLIVMSVASKRTDLPRMVPPGLANN
jgi:DNA repair exonuclease SbcCD nuclease subunit